jgi:hypothetical protein
MIKFKVKNYAWKQPAEVILRMFFLPRNIKSYGQDKPDGVPITTGQSVPYRHQALPGLHR